MVPPPEATNPQMPIARALSEDSVKVVTTIESAAGAMSAPPMPCRARAATSALCESASPQNSEARVNRASPPMTTRRRPRISPALPPRSRKPPKVNR